jgi:ribosomal-protein-alanine N-acetyltransferase
MADDCDHDGAGVTQAQDIIRAGPLHADVLAALHATSFAAPWRADEFAALLSQPGVAAWISMSIDTPTGFIMLRAVVDEAEILTLAVTPEQRRTGVARRLINQARKALADGETARLFLEVAADNTAALGLYRNCGFAVCGRRANYYTSGGDRAVDAVLMSLAINS